MTRPDKAQLAAASLSPHRMIHHRAPTPLRATLVVNRAMGHSDGRRPALIADYQHPTSSQASFSPPRLLGSATCRRPGKSRLVLHFLDPPDKERIIKARNVKPHDLAALCPNRSRTELRQVSSTIQHRSGAHEKEPSCALLQPTRHADVSVLASGPMPSFSSDPANTFDDEAGFVSSSLAGS